MVAEYPTSAQEKPVTAHIKIEKKSATNLSRSAGSDAASVVVWLVALDRSGTKDIPRLENRPQIVQKNKTFQPHVTVVPIGSVVDFPNHDPFFHNVFSLFDGKRFDLGLYEAGVTNSVRFDHSGISFLFCNIHPEMSAIVVAVNTPYYGVSDRLGKVTIKNVVDGKYELHVWFERGPPEQLTALTRTAQISAESRDLGTLVVAEDPLFSPVHKNKYGQDYAPPPKSGYPQP